MKIILFVISNLPCLIPSLVLALLLNHLHVTKSEITEQCVFSFFLV